MASRPRPNAGPGAASGSRCSPPPRGYNSPPPRGYKKLDYRAVYPADSSLLLRQDAWPPHLRWILDTFLASEDGIQRGKVTPRFFLAQNRQITFTATGIAG